MVGGPDYYVGDDERLWDWLHADNVRSDSSLLMVAAPEGYVFNAARGLVKYLPSYGEVAEMPTEYPAFTQNQYLRPGPVEAGKTMMLMNEYSNCLTYFSENDFSALGIDESRVRTVHFFY